MSRHARECTDRIPEKGAGAYVPSPEQLTDYLCVTDPGIRVLLAAAFLLLGALAASIDTMEEQIQDDAESLTRITAEKERVSTELSLAARIQAAMMPHNFPAFPRPQQVRHLRGHGSGHRGGRWTVS